MVRLFFGFHLYLAERFCENFQSARGAMQCKSGQVSNMISKRNLSIVPFFINNSLPPCQFLRDNIFLKKKNQLGEILVEQTIEFKLRGPGPPSRTCTSVTGYFHDKTKTSKGYLRVDYFII